MIDPKQIPEKSLMDLTAAFYDARCSNSMRIRRTRKPTRSGRRKGGNEMANRAGRGTRASIRNNIRQREYQAKGIVMLPTLREEKKARKKRGEKK